MFTPLKSVITGAATLMIAVGVSSTVLALMSVLNADRDGSYSINFPGTWEAVTVAQGTDFGDQESISVAGIIAALAGTWTMLVVLSQPDNSRTYLASLVFDLAAPVVALEALLYSFITTYTSDSTPQRPFSTETLGYIGRRGTYSLEAWTCGVKDLGHLSEYAPGAFVGMCARARAARWLMLPLFVVSLISVVLSWTWRKKHKRPSKSSPPTQVKEMGKHSDSAS